MSEEDFQRYLVFKRTDVLFQVPQGKNYVWYNPNPKDPDTFESGEVINEGPEDIRVKDESGAVYSSLLEHIADPYFVFRKSASVKSGLLLVVPPSLMVSKIWPRSTVF